MEEDCNVRLVAPDTPPCNSRVLAISGCSGAGKSTLSDALTAPGMAFTLRPAVTTRAPRPDDRDSQYRYVTHDDFDALEKDLVTLTTYRGNRYGITWQDLRATSGEGRVSVVVIAPDSLEQFIRETGRVGGFEVRTVFLDARDQVLDDRLTARDGSLPSDANHQRLTDRSFSRLCDAVLRGRSTGAAVRVCLGLCGMDPRAGADF